MTFYTFVVRDKEFVLEEHSAIIIIERVYNLGFNPRIIKVE